MSICYGCLDKISHLFNYLRIVIIIHLNNVRYEKKLFFLYRQYFSGNDGLGISYEK